MKIYTKTGDDGTTGLLGNQRVRKDDVRIETSGALDELNAVLGVVLAHAPLSAQKARPWLETIQNDLFAIGAIVATPSTETRAFAVLAPDRISQLERLIDDMESELQPLRDFILPQGSPAVAYTHLARAVARRAERRLVAMAGAESVSPAVLAYVNRLADFLFVLARWINRQEGGLETLATIAVPSGGTAPTPSPDRLNATLKKLEQEKKDRQTLFEKAASDLQKKKEQAEKVFRQKVDEVNKEGGKVEPPPSPFDLD